MKITDNRFLVMFSLLLLAWALVYQDALVGMEAIWSRSDTFAHGYFILPISIWLLWRDKANLLASTVQPSWLALPLLAVSLFVGLFAYAADINVLGQLSAVTSLIFLLWLFIGNKLTWRYKFPLAYLLFAVPMGENLIPWLQDVTAWFTVSFLKLNDIPVYVDGLYIQIPTGMFEVAVACSGIRYLIASAAVGALYGHLTYQKTHKQIIFFVFALTLPILANGIRAYGIVAIAYYSDMEYATGADHLVYGWLFFGLIIMLMFWIGGFFADQPDDTNNKSRIENPPSDNHLSLYYVPGLSALLFVVSFYLFQAIPSVNMAEKSLGNEVKVNSSWGITFIDALESSQHTNEKGIDIFHAFYANKQSRGEMISSKNAMHDQDRWTVVASKELISKGRPIILVHLRNINGVSRSYLYQFKVGAFYSVNENKVKLRQAWNSLSRQSDISEVRAMSLTDQDDLDLAEQSLLAAFSEISFSNINIEKHQQEGLNSDLY